MIRRTQVRVREIGTPDEARRREAFRALVEAQDNGVEVLTARRDVARRFGLSPAMLRAIEAEGIVYDWPPLAPEAVPPGDGPQASNPDFVKPGATSRAPALPPADTGKPVATSDVFASFRDRLRTAWADQVGAGNAAGQANTKV
jgi:hypothetical protein